MTSVREQIVQRRKKQMATRLRALATQELQRLRDAKNPSRDDPRRNLGLVDYVAALSPRWEPPQHLAPVAALFERAMRGETVRACVSVPAQFGKTTLIQHGIVQMLSRHPTWPIVYASYSADFAHDRSKEIRDLAREAGLSLRDDTSAAGRWRLVEGGGLLATGIGGPLTGYAAQVVVVDDPHKNREEAESRREREKISDWLRSTALTRISPTGSCLVVHCMVGATQVLMADGSQRELQNLRVGDSVATYANGALSTSTVLNWANQGPDSIFAIKTSSGTIVRANERHPFLVKRGDGAEWIKLRDLQVGDAIVQAMRPTGLGAGSNAPSKTARQLRSAKGSAILITRKQKLHRVTSVNRTPPKIAEPFICERDTGSIKTAIMLSCESKVDSAPCVGSLQKKEGEPIGAESSASITTMRLDESAGCSVTAATLQSDTSSHPKHWSAPLNTYVITSDPIVSITPDGIEDVFDIQVADTENFIANGLVSHNTRWHPDDLIGRLEADGWEVVNLPAVNADDESLWPSQRPREFLRQREREVGPYEWAALYMGQPRARGGAVFSATPTTYTTPPGELTRGIGLDLAYSAKTSADWSVAVVMGKAGSGADARYYVLDVLRAQMRASDFAQQLAALRLRWPHTASRIYAGGADRGALDFLALPPPRGVGLQVDVKAALGDKYSRATPLAAAWNAGRVLVREGAAWLPDLCDEIARFTGQNDAHDDQVDALAAAFDLLAEMHVGSGIASTGRRASADLTTDYAPRVGRKNYWG